MNTIKLTIFALFIFLSAAFGQSVLKYVNPFICTAGDHGQLDPSATVPFGMIKIGPDTEPGNHSGYDYNAHKIAGFSQNRIGGVGCSGAGGNLRILPGIGKVNFVSLPYDKKSEKASPCFYSVKFNNGISAELTATNNTGFEVFTFPKSNSSYIVFNIRTSFAGTIKASDKFINKHEFFVTVSAENVCSVGRYTVYYHVWCSKVPQKIENSKNRIIYKFKTKDQEKVMLKVTASSISPNDAESEWKDVAKDLTFNKVKQRGMQKWSELLSRIKVEGKEEYKTIFYTHLYHSILNPVRTENSLKEFHGTDGQIHKAENYVHYDCWSMWDNYRDIFSLYSFLVPDISNDIANSLIDMYKYGKAYWAGFNEPVPTVRTEHTVITLLDLYNRGIRNFNIMPMYHKLSAEINNISSTSPDEKLEQSYDFWALSQFAKILHKKDDYKLFLEKALEYKDVWKKYFLPISSKSDSIGADGVYEGTLWQYRWDVPFDMQGMIKMIGGKEKFTDQLEYFFDHHLYNHGNQPDLQASFMFNYGTKPWLTQKWVNKILTKKMIQRYGTHEIWKKPYIGRIYKDAPAGYIPEMDDDEGTMSSWYVLSSMGMYPVLVGKPVFQISTPIFSKITINLKNGKKFIIKTNNLSDKNIYIQSATLNGKPFNQDYISQSDITNGGILVFNVSDVPNKTWGIQK